MKAKPAIVDDRALLKLGVPVHSDREVTQLKSPVINMSLELAGRRYARSWVNKVSCSCIFLRSCWGANTYYPCVFEESCCPSTGW